jgi:hypothetical protein
MADVCSHLATIRKVAPNADTCEDCPNSGGSWVHLRICLACRHVGCCDDSPNRHATCHYHQLSHPIIQSFEPGEDWIWCFEDGVMVAPL